MPSFFLYSAPDMKRKTTKIQGNRKKESEKDEDQEMYVKGSGVKKERKGFWKAHNLFN